ncbi:MAG: hypothetical protein R2710_18665 [Acidimicrobiales bacterium]
MRFELTFLPRSVDGADPAHRLVDRRSPTEPSDRALVMWARIGDRLGIEMPTLEHTTIDGGPSYLESEHGLTLTLDAGTLHLSAPAGPVDDATALDMLRRVAAIVETVTGLVACDPGTQRRFLHDDLDGFGTFAPPLQELTH